MVVRSTDITYTCDRCKATIDGGFASSVNENGWRNIAVQSYTGDREVLISYMSYDLCRECYVGLSAFLRMDKPVHTIVE
jgi:hypothetical protein